MKAFLSNLAYRVTGAARQQDSRLAELSDAIQHSLGCSDEEKLEDACSALREYLSQLTTKQHILDVRRGLAAGYFDLGVTARETGNQDKAQVAYEESMHWLDSLRDTTHHKFSQTQLAACHNHLGIMFMANGLLEHAATEYDSAISVRQAIRKRYPKDLENKVYLGGALCNRANVAHDLGDNNKARLLFDESIEMIDEAVPECECGTADVLVGVLQQVGASHWIILARQFRENAKLGRQRLAVTSS